MRSESLERLRVQFGGNISANQEYRCLADDETERNGEKVERTNRIRKSIACQQGTIRNEGRHDGFESPRGPTDWIKTRNRVVFFFRARLNLLCKHSTSSAGAIRRFFDPSSCRRLFCFILSSLLFFRALVIPLVPSAFVFILSPPLKPALSPLSKCHYSTASRRTE